MKEMLAKRNYKKLTKKIPIGSDKKSSHGTGLDFRERILGRMEKQDNSFSKTMKGFQQNMQVLTHTISKAFQMISQIFASTYKAPVHSYYQPVHSTQNYDVFPNYLMNEALNTHSATLPQYPHPLFSRYDEVHSSTEDGVRESNSSNEN